MPQGWGNLSASYYLILCNSTHVGLLPQFTSKCDHTYDKSAFAVQVLSAYAGYNPEFGYAQGMNFIVVGVRCSVIFYGCGEDLILW